MKDAFAMILGAALEVPAIVRLSLLALAKGRAPGAQLISRTIMGSASSHVEPPVPAGNELLATGDAIGRSCTDGNRGRHRGIAIHSSASGGSGA